MCASLEVKNETPARESRFDLRGNAACSWAESPGLVTRSATTLRSRSRCAFPELAMRLPDGLGEEESVPGLFDLDEAASVLVAFRDAFPLGYLEFSPAQKYALVLLAEHFSPTFRLFGQHEDPDHDWRPVSTPSLSTISARRARSEGLPGAWVGRAATVRT